MSFSKYVMYKDSGIEWLGRVPSEWGIAPIKAVASCNDEVLPESTGSEAVIEYVEISGVQEGRGVTETETLAFGSAPSRARRVVRHGDVLISTVRTYLRAIATVSNPPENLVASTGFAVIRPRVVHAGFLGYLLHAEYLVSEVIARSVGISYPAINASELMRLKAPIPPLQEQRAIAAFLDRETAKIDALVAEQKKLIELLKEKRQAVISHAVTKGLDPNVPMKDSGVEWLGAVPAHWEVKRFGDACASISTGPFGTALGSADYVSGGIPVINPSHIVDDRVVPDDEVSVANDSAERLSAWTLRMGDIVVARRGELGRAAVVTPESDGWICGTGSLRVTPNANRATAEFLHAILQSRYAREWLNQASVGSTMANLNEGILARLPVVLTPTIGEQLELTHALEGRLAEITAVEMSADACVALLLERRSALISAAVTGQIDVRGLSAEQATAAS